MGLLANVDSSICNVVLDKGFEIKSIKLKELINFLNIIEDRRESYYIAEELLMIYPKYETTEKISQTNDYVFFIEKSFEISDDWDQSAKNMVELAEFHKKYFEQYLVETLQLMRLYKEGNICIPYYFYYCGDMSKPKVVTRPEKLPIHSLEEYSLEDQEITALQDFINSKWHFDFKEDFFKIAFECYNLSYEINKVNLQFLTLMTGLEVLFVASKEEKITKTVSRNTAIVIGDSNNGEKIYDDMGKFYGTRSKIVHGGNRNIITQSQLIRLRKYLRKAINEMNFIISEEPNLHGNGGKIRLTKFKNDDEYLKRNFKQNISYLLYSCGFGDKPWR
jgi:hypothetical protein